MKLLKQIAAVFAAGILVVTGCSSDGGQTEQQTTISSFVPTSAEKVQEASETPSKGFYVEGTKLYDANGNEFIMRGINHAHTWFKERLDVSLEAIAATGSNCVRIVLSNGMQWTKDELESVQDIIAKCKKLKLAAIVEVHDGTGKDDAKVLDGIADYWIEMKEALVGNEAYVILNIANEWLGGWDSDSWGGAYCDAVKKLRDAGIENLIMVDAAGWGQFGQSIADKGTEVFEADKLRNTMFSIHMYGTAGGSKGKIKKNIDGVLDKGLCLCIGEFGYNHSDGDVDEEFIMEYCAEKGVGYLGWSWKGNGGGVEYLDIAKEWDGSVLSDDWGEPLINGKNGIRETARTCSVYE